MLQSIRDRLTGPVALGIVGLIVVPFAFWGIDSYVRTPGNPTVAEVGGMDISQAQLQRSYDQGLQRLQSLLGEQFQPGMIDPPRFKRGVLDNLIQESLLEQQAQDGGFRVSDDLVLQALRGEAAFQKDGAFSSDRYREVLARAGLNPTVYEADLRRGMAVEQLQRGLRATAFATQSDVGLGWRLEQQQRELAYLTYSAERYKNQAVITDDQVKARYQRDEASYRTQERLKLSYVELNRAELKAAPAPAPELLKVIYEAEKLSRFATPEQRKARHILIRVGAGSDETAAKGKIESIRKQLTGGADFSELAKSASEDTGSKSGGGDLGWVGKGVMVPEFEQALFALDKGQLSDPVKTSFGWHLIRLDDVKPQQVKAFNSAEVQNELLRLYRDREADERFQQLSKRLDELAFDEPGSLQPSARALNVSVQTSDWITREAGSGIGDFVAVRTAAFSDAVLKEKENSTPIELSPGRLAVIRIAEYEPARQKPLAEVEDELRTQLKQEAGREAAQRAAEAARKALEEGERSPAQQASQDGASLRSATWVGRASTGNAVPAEVLRAAFELPRPSGGKPRYAVTSTASGDQMVLVFSAVRDGQAAEAESTALQSFQIRSAAEVSAQEFAAYLAHVREQRGVTVNEQSLQ